MAKVLILQTAPCLVIEPGPPVQVTRSQQLREIYEIRNVAEAQPDPASRVRLGLSDVSDLMVSTLTVSVIK